MQSPCVPYHYPCLPQNLHLRRENTSWLKKEKNKTGINLNFHFTLSANKQVLSSDERMKVCLKGLTHSKRISKPSIHWHIVVTKIAVHSTHSRPVHVWRREEWSTQTNLNRTESHLWPYLTFVLPCLFHQTLPCWPCYPCCQSSHHSFL